MIKPSDGIEILDPQAIENYRTEIKDLTLRIQKAKDNNDIAHHEQFQKELHAIQQQVTSAQALGSRSRKSKNENDNARTSLTNAISRAIQRIQRNHTDLARHLDNSIRSGQFFSYAPETDADWSL